MKPELVVESLRRTHLILLEQSDAEAIAAALSVGDDRTVLPVEGRDLISGLRKRIEVRKQDIWPPDEPIHAIPSQ